jgi:hypothetical protein
MLLCLSYAKGDKTVTESNKRTEELMRQLREFLTHAQDILDELELIARQGKRVQK